MHPFSFFCGSKVNTTGNILFKLVFQVEIDARCTGSYSKRVVKSTPISTISLIVHFSKNGLYSGAEGLVYKSGLDVQTNTLLIYKNQTVDTCRSLKYQNWASKHNPTYLNEHFYIRTMVQYLGQGLKAGQCPKVRRCLKSQLFSN